MTTPNQYEIVPDEIRGHANSVANVADDLSSIAARLPAGLGDDALGSFAQFVTSGLTGAMNQVASATADASTSVHEMSSGLNRTAETYQDIEHTNADNLTREFIG